MSDIKADETIFEVDILTKYLVGKKIRNEKIYAIYKHLTDGQINDRATSMAFKYPGLLPFLDAGLVFAKTSSDLRRRIHIVFSSLESTPQYAELFMPQKVGFFGTLLLILVGIRGVFRAIVGLVILKALRI